MAIKDIVESTIHKYHTRDPYELAEHLHICISRHELGKIRGYYLKKYRIKQIILNSDLDRHEEKFVLAHEIGHAILHPDVSTPFLTEHTFLSVNRLEVEANKFAVELLIPDEKILENWQMTTEQLGQMLGYSKDLIELRLK